MSPSDSLQPMPS